MGAFEQYNPLAVAVYFLTVIGIAMFSMNPIVLFLSVAGSIALYLKRNGMRNIKIHLYSMLIFLLMALINPLVSHNGVTVLFVLNHNPVTFEAFIYGIASSAMIISVLYWFRSFSQIMTSDKLLYIFGAMSPKLALILSMALRYVPLFGSQVKKVNNAQKALGLYKDDNIVDSFKGGIRVFSVMVTWALENGIVTADSMTARGYGIGKRTHFSIFKCRKQDVLLLLTSIILFALTLMGLLYIEFVYYPAISMSISDSFGIAGYIFYGVLVFLPLIIEITEDIKWKYLKSKI